jgi:hypothetical protein
MDSNPYESPEGVETPPQLVLTQHNKGIADVARATAQAACG